MCNDFEQVISWRAYKAAMEGAGFSVPIDESEADLPPREHVRVRDTAPIIRAAGNGIELVSMGWSFPPPRPGGKPGCGEVARVLVRDLS
jgi:hypothetical protein